MIPISKDISGPYLKILSDSKVPVYITNQYTKWLRFYLDFCYRYHFSPQDPDSLPHFTQKLESKNQGVRDREQAVVAVSLYYQIFDSKESFPKKETVDNWDNALLQLQKEIQVRQYSPKTLATYLGWNRRFRTFLKDKPIVKIDSKDAKNFLQYLAINRKVASTTQNQAFNSMLFFYRHVLRVDFGEHKDTIRAKRKRYLPAVLTFDEINKLFRRLDYPHNLIAKLLYGCGLRISECLNLRVKDIDFAEEVLTARSALCDRLIRFYVTIFFHLNMSSTINIII